MSRYAKSIYAFFGSLLATVGAWGVAAAPDGIEGAEWFGLLVALGGTLGTTGLVYGIPNTPPTGQAADPQMSEQHDPTI